MDALDLTARGLAAPAVGLLVLRVFVGVPFALHGFQKLFGWFGGGGLHGTAGWFRSLGFGEGRPAALLAGISEVAGGLGLAAGLLTPFAAAAMIGTMTTAAFVNNAAGGFWSVRKGWELNGYLVAIASAVAITGPGMFSIDHVLGFDGLWGAVPGSLAIGVGVAGGGLQWMSRSRPGTQTDAAT